MIKWYHYLAFGLTFLSLPLLYYFNVSVTGLDQYPLIMTKTGSGKGSEGIFMILFLAVILFYILKIFFWSLDCFYHKVCQKPNDLL